MKLRIRDKVSVALANVENSLHNKSFGLFFNDARTDRKRYTYSSQVLCIYFGVIL